MTETTQIPTKYELWFEARITRLETQNEMFIDIIKEVKTDLRWMFGIMLGFSGILLGLMAKGFHWLA